MSQGSGRRFLLGLASVMFAVLPPLQALSQATQPDSVERAIAVAREAGVPVLVIDSATGPAPVSPTPAAGLSERAAQLASTISANLKQTLADVANAPETLPSTIAAMSPNGTVDWPFRALALAVATLVAGWLAERLLAALIARRSPLSPPPDHAPRSQRIRFILLDTLIRGLLVAGGLAFALVLAVSLSSNGSPERTVILSVFEAVIYVRAALLFFGAVLVPGSPGAQLAGISGDMAPGVHARLRHGTWIAGAVAALALWLTRIGAAGGLVIVASVLLALVVATVLARAAWSLQAILIARSRGVTQESWWLRNWPAVVTVYLWVAVFATTAGQLAGAHTSGIVIAPATAAILATIIYAVSLLIVDASFRAQPAQENQRGPSFRGWAERAALIVASSIAVCTVLGAWGASFFLASGSVRPVYTILLISIAAYIGWSAIRTAFDRKIAEERGSLGPQAEDADEGGPGGTRLATLLPLFRNAILIAILVLAAMVALSAIGVDIAPLFAGAGLIGFAVGFGAQTLVRDIFSGVFFLIDDAFRVGEYIETGNAKGTVEKISIRSMQLRHQNGPLHTVPFGEITQLTNYSRDWVIMKLPIRVRFGTDTERVRKLIKKLGVELLQHPEVGYRFVEPLKSQGVYQMDEFGIVTRVKFKTKPGDQFAVRKIVYQKINELFEREGIAFGGREVIVRAADDGQRDNPAPLSPEVAGAAAEAAKPRPPG